MPKGGLKLLLNPKVLFVAFTLIAFFGAGIKFLDAGWTALPLKEGIVWLFLSAAILLFISHLTRVIRLWIMFIENPVKIRQLGAIHFHTAWVVITIPFKVGEFFRLSEFIRISGSRQMGTAIFIVEKISDLLALFLLVSASLFGAEHFVVNVFLAITAILIAVSLLVWFGLSSIILFAKQAVLKFSSSRRSLGYLNIIRRIEDVQSAINSVTRFRFGLILSISLFAWGIDFLAYLCIGGIAYKDIRGFYDLFAETIGQLFRWPGGSGDAQNLYLILRYGLLSLMAIPAILVSWRTFGVFKRRFLARPYFLGESDRLR